MRSSLAAHAPRIAMLAALTALLAPPSHAAISIQRANGTAVPAESVAVTFNPKTGGYDINLNQIYAPQQDTVFNIRGNAGEIIDNIFINTAGPAAGSPVIVRVFSDAPGGVSTVKNIEQTAEAEVLLNAVTVNQDIGSVSVLAIGTLDAGRDILGPITATTPDSTSRGISNAIAHRDIRGDISAPAGRIGLVYAYRHIGTLLDPVLISARHDVLQVSAVNDLYADIDTRTGANGTLSNGAMYALTANRFFGTVHTTTIIANPYNGLPGGMRIYSDFQGTVRIGQSFQGSGQWLEFPPNGLTGQVIINADNVPGSVWGSPVKLGPDGSPGQVVLNGPTYTNPRSSIGGGSVGVVPFRLHPQSCVPPSGSVMNAPVNQPVSVDLVHYGPIVMMVGNPVNISSRPAGSSGAFSLLPWSDFTFSIDIVNDPNALHIAKAPGRPGFAPGFEYKISVNNLVKCNIDSLPAVSWASDYTFTVLPGQGPTCPQDIAPVGSPDGVVGIADLLAVIGTWGPCQPDPAPCAADISPSPAGDNVVGIADLLSVIGNWGTCD